MTNENRVSFFRCARVRLLINPKREADIAKESWWIAGGAELWARWVMHVPGSAIATAAEPREVDRSIVVDSAEAKAFRAEAEQIAGWWAEGEPTETAIMFEPL